jgi:hypothetical protein
MSAGARMARGPVMSFGLQTGNNSSGDSRTASSPGQLPSPCRTATSTSSRAKST